MQVKSQNIETPPVFVPFKLELTFESQRELDAFYSLFNHPVNTDFVSRNGIRHEVIRKHMESRVSVNKNIMHDELCISMSGFHL